MTRINISLLLLLALHLGYAQQRCVHPDSCWAFAVTSDNHSIIIPDSVPTVNGAPLPLGSYIGVFFDSGNGRLKSAGYRLWQGNNTSLSAFGNDGATPPIGFTTGQTFYFKFLLPSGLVVENLQSSFEAPPGPLGLLSDTNRYDNNGISQLAFLSGDTVATDSCFLIRGGKIVTGNNSPVKGVKVYLNGGSSDSTFTAADGSFEFAHISMLDTVKLFKPTDSIARNGITTLDIVLIRRHILNSSDPLRRLSSPYKLIAADVDSSGDVTTLDMLHIRNFILGNTSSFPGNKLWTFVASDYAFADLLNPFPFNNFRIYDSSSCNNDFIGIKLGDVNNSWDPDFSKMGTVGEVFFKINEQLALPNEEVVIPVRIKDFKNISGYQFTISWDTAVLSLNDIENAALQGYFGENKIADGVLTTSWCHVGGGAVSLDDNDTIFQLYFTVVGNIGSQSLFEIGSDETAAEAYNGNLELLSVNSTAGNLTVATINTVFAQNPSWLNHYPNPTTSKIFFEFSLSQSSNVVLNIYDYSGKQIRSESRTISNGSKTIETNIIGQPQGQYFYELITSESSQRGKIVLLD